MRLARGPGRASPGRDRRRPDDTPATGFVCPAAGTPGTWRLITRVTADPSRGIIPTGYLILNVTDGAVKRHAGAYSWEITVGASAAAKIGFRGATPTAQRAGTAQTAVTYASQTSSDPPTQAQAQALNDGLVAVPWSRS